MAQTTAHDVIRALTDTHEKLADRLDNAPTGVTPGYNEDLGGTVNPNGTLRYVGTAKGLLCVAQYTASPQTVTTASVRVQFDTVQYDRRSIITTGASWKIDLPAIGWYRGFVHLQIDKKNNTAAAGEVWQAVLYDSTLSTNRGVMAQLEFFVAVSSATHSAYDLVGQREFHISALPATLAVAFDRNTTTQNRDIVGGQFALDYLGGAT